MVTAPSPPAALRNADRLDPVRSAWVAGYRAAHPDADRWATGTSGIKHSPATQERVFRMVEQLAHRGLERSSIFTALHSADRTAGSTGDPEAAAAAGYQAMEALERVDPEAVLITQDDCVDELEAFGFEPIRFDARDPAAYAWLTFELSCRHGDDENEAAASCDCHAPSDAIPIGVAESP